MGIGNAKANCGTVPILEPTPLGRFGHVEEAACSGGTPDLLKLGWSSYDGERLTLRQGKRKRKVDMPVAAPLKRLLDATPRLALTILTGPNGKPWRTDPKPTHFQHEWRKAVLEAGLDGLHFHDLRGTTCTLLAEAGATPSEIAAMLGWTVATVNQMLDTYQAMTRPLSDSAVAKLERGHTRSTRSR